MNNLHPMSEKPTRVGHIILQIDENRTNIIECGHKAGVACFYIPGVYQSKTWADVCLPKYFTGWRYLTIENDKLSKMISQFKVFAKIVFAHLYGEITKDVCEWRGDHLSRSNIELISEIKEHLKVKP